ncbi:PQQ-dependent sugar dehydrogenase [Verrucomicrobiota bacterium sgz303538]
MKRFLLLCTGLLSAVVHHSAIATAPAGFSESVFLANPSLGQATGMAWAPDGSNRLFVTRKTGEVRVIQNGALNPTPFAVFPQVYTNSECGLIGICFDPDFLTNRFVYFFVTISATEQQIIRYTDNNGTGAAPTVIVSGLPTQGQNHDGGAIAIGPDGFLYWAIGDLGNGTGVNSDLTSLAAKVGRANRFTGQPVDDNPFNDGVGPNNEYIWARGFRNPFTMTFQPRTGAVWLNVVGTGYEQVFVVGRGDHGGYGSYENDQPAGFLEPKIAYRTNGIDTRNIVVSGAVRAGGVATFTTTAAHGFRAGAKITIAGVANPSFNGTFFVRDRLSTTSFTVAQAGADATSGGGTAQTANIGGALTGGCFYDSTLFPQEYHGNFFFGDYNSGQITRAVLDSSNTVMSVDSFITGSSSNVDITTGPDGALYYIGNSGNTLRRLVPSAPQQNLIIYPTALTVQEGGRALFTVRLAQEPTAPVTINISKLEGGDADLTALGSSLTFDSTNWNQVQSVVIQAGNDADSMNGTATFQVSAPGIAQYDVQADEIDSIVQTVPISELLYRSGNQVPGEPDGTVFTTLGIPSLDSSHVGFLATIKSGKTSLPAILGGAPTSVLVRKNDPAPGTDGVFSSFKDPVFGGGRYAFIGALKTGAGVSPGNNDGIWSAAGGPLQLIAREGNEAPGTNGALFQTFLSLALPKTGGSLFVARLKTGSGEAGSKVNGSNDVGLWRETGGTPVLVLREGADISINAGAARRVKSFQTLRFVPGSEDQQRSHRADGDLLILVNFQDNTQAIVEAPGDGSSLVAKVLTGDTVTNPADATLKALGLPAGRTGNETFIGTLNEGPNITAANDTAVFAGSEPGTFAAQIREGDIAPDTGGATFASFGIPALGGTSPTLILLGTLKQRTGTPSVKASNDTGIWTNTSGSMRLFAREGDIAPGTGGTFAKFLSFAAAPDAAPLKAIPFTAQLRTRGGVTAKNNLGLWARDANGTVWLLQRTGQSVSLPDATNAKITALSALKSTPQTAGQGRATNDSGQIIYRANLKGKGQAIFRVQMP